MYKYVAEISEIEELIRFLILTCLILCSVLKLTYYDNIRFRPGKTPKIFARAKFLDYTFPQNPINLNRKKSRQNTCFLFMVINQLK